MPLIRDLQLVLLEEGGAEVVDVDTDETIWASDTDEDFGEEFPDLLEEEDLPQLQNYLESKGICTAREIECMECIEDPGDEDDEEEDDEDPFADEDIIDGEVIDRE